MPQFADSEATTYFIRVINDAFDILNSRSKDCFGFKRALCCENIDEINSFVSTATKYLSKLKFSNNELLIESRRKTGFVGLIVSLKNLNLLYSSYIKTEKLSFIQHIN